MPLGFGRGRGRRSGRRGRGFGKGRSTGDLERGGFPANCVCPRCGFIVAHQPGVSCYQTKCPKCGLPMTRQFSYEE